jgi:type II secretory pathway component GspD/PulD (secretin)
MTNMPVPVLGDIPAIGLHFSNHTKNIVNTETVVLSMPKIVGQQLHTVDTEMQSAKDTVGVFKHTVNATALSWLNQE